MRADGQPSFGSYIKNNETSRVLPTSAVLLPLVLECLSATFSLPFLKYRRSIRGRSQPLPLLRRLHRQPRRVPTTGYDNDVPVPVRGRVRRRNGIGRRSPAPIAVLW